MWRAGGVLAGLAAGAALGACGSNGVNGSSKSYPTTARAHFMAVCERHGSLAGCDCILHRLETSVPVSDLVAAEAILDGSARTLPGWASKAIDGCA